jgi:hypothetical protein
MPKLATTRFNEQTWKENDKWRRQHAYVGCIYGTPMLIKSTVFDDDLLFIIEMKNHENQVGAIGMIKNMNFEDKSYHIYSDGNYNRYIYKSKYRISREELKRDPAFAYQEKIMQIFDVILFKGARHYKRGQGITCIPDYISKNKYFDFIQFFKNMFIKRFGYKQSSHLNNNIL